MVTGDYSIEFEDDPQPGDIVLPFGMVWFNAKKFACRTCGLRLDSTLEMSTAGMSSGHAVEDADPRDFQPAFDAAAHDEWRAERLDDGEEWPYG